jgi:hypothetical protein
MGNPLPAFSILTPKRDRWRWHLLPTTETIRKTNIDIYIYILYTYGDRHPPKDTVQYSVPVVGILVSY